MNQLVLRKVMTGLFLVLAFSFLSYQRLHKPRIFILHSYHESMPWVARLNQGIHAVFSTKPYISIRYYYMDSKRRHSKSYLNRIYKSAMAAIESWDPDIIIAFDNEAQHLIASEKEKLKNTRIIIAGATDAEHWEDYKNNPNLTAITEEIPVHAIREVLSLIFRQQRRIYFLSDNSEASASLEANMLKQNWGAYEIVGKKRVKSVAAWQAAVREAEKTADIILVATYQSIKDARRLKAAQLIAWTTQHAKIPSVGVYESFSIDGGLIAIAISALEQGYSAGWIALQVLENRTEMKDIPLMKGKSFNLFINKSKLRKTFPDARIPVILDTFSKSESKFSKQ